MNTNEKTNTSAKAQSKAECAYLVHGDEDTNYCRLAESGNLLADLATLKDENEGLKAVSTTCKRITLCGSTRFKKAFMEWNARLTLQGAVVYSVAMWSHNIRVEPTEEQKELLDVIHKAKIDASDEIFVLDVGGYIGSSTRSEINHALSTCKAVRYLSSEYPDWTEADCTYAQDDDLASLKLRVETAEKERDDAYNKAIDDAIVQLTLAVVPNNGDITTVANDALQRIRGLKR
jgi:hypothetical protein